MHNVFLSQADEQDPVLSQRARLHLEKYNFPVEMMVALPNGTIVSPICFPDFFCTLQTQLPNNNLSLSSLGKVEA